MNVVISNKKQSLLENLGIDVIKEMHGEYSVEEIVNTFQNFFYQRMILDLTAIQGYEDISTIQSLASSLNMSKVILILDGTSVTNNKNYISKLISLGIYNFTDNAKGVQYLYNYPNTYDDVSSYHNASDNFTSTTTQTVSDENDEVKNIKLSSNKNDTNINSNVATDNVSTNSNNTNFISNNNVTQNDNQKVEGVSETSYNFLGDNSKVNSKIIGIKNLTRESGATSLTYMIVKSLNHKYKAVGIEVNKNDFVYFKDNNLISATSDNIEVLLKKYDTYDAVIIDLNDNLSCESLCNEIIYLIEPSIIKLQKLMSLNKDALKGYKNKKVILNQSLLDSKAVNAFEYESGLKFFYNLRPLNERENDFDDLNKMLIKLGFTKLK